MNERFRCMPCGTVKARLLDHNGKPIANTPVSITPVKLNDATQRFVVGLTDPNGHFETSRVIPLTEFQFMASSSPLGSTIGKSVQLKPGELLDLGDVPVDQPDRPSLREKER